MAFPSKLRLLRERLAALQALTRAAS